jgi:lipocalin-like protein
MKKYLLIFLAFALFAACSDDDDTTDTLNKSFLHGDYSKMWKYSVIYVDGAKTDLPPSHMDDMMLFNYDGTGFSIFGEVDLGVGISDIKSDPITWTIEGDMLKMKDMDVGHDNDFFDVEIVSLSETEMVVKYTDKDKLFEVTFIPFCPNDALADDYSKNLTHGMIKLWKISEAYKDDVKQEELPFRTDDMLLFASNFKGMVLKGSVHKDDDDLPNDLFTWSANADYSEITLTDFEHAHYVPELMKVTELTADKFTYETTRPNKGGENKFKIVCVPVLD